MSDVRLGAVFAPDRPLEELVGAARAFEAAGLDELWVVEDCFLHGGLTAAASVLASTERLSVGLGLLPVAVRNPAIGAMELATLARLHPGRFRAAFGHGVEAWMRQIDARPPDRLVALREVVRATRALLAGEQVDADGAWVRLREVALAHPPEVAPPVLVGTTGPRGIAIAAREADGLVLPEGASAAAVAWARDALGAAGELVVYLWARVEDGAEAARAVVREPIERWRAWGLYPELLARSALGAEPSPSPSDAAIAEVGAVGTPEDCASAIRRLADAGATTVVLLPLGDDPDGQVARFGRDVLPLVRA